MATVDLNCDLGEGFDDAALFPLVTSANIACGVHAGDDATMEAACRLAVRHRVAIGAHPSYPDREGFGRRDMDLGTAELRSLVLDQVAALRRAADRAGGAVRYLKPHGALYNRIARDPGPAGAVAAAAAEAQLPLLGPASSAIADAADRHGVPFFREAFPDRGYTADGRLAPRGTTGSVIESPDDVAERALALALTGRVRSVDGGELALEVDSLCLHGDSPGAPAAARAVRDRLSAAGVRLGSFA
ncbi:LamB/YcsF family protein [Naasia sp. SYSU D00057]|uniref:LamB/YcsF family protein n=1 Tax=Naasia sp. SYSU D00057 TaxID=2817380 RepID=UPI001B30E88C|nr:5-oxoprolinase subunit PxpA [Naasia sp. SYSU D00057]